MRKVVNSISLALILAAAGCTTNVNPGNGQPSNTPNVTPTSTPGASSGSTPVSSVSPADRKASAADAIAVLTEKQAYEGRVLGSTTVPPAGAGVAGTGAVVAPATSSGTTHIVSDPSGTVTVTNVTPAKAAATANADQSRIRRLMNFFRRSNPDPPKQ